MKFSDAELDEILRAAEKAWEHNRLPKSRKKEFILTLGIYLTKPGLNENVCHSCLGTGKNG